jgi:hypothetical protein
MDGLRGGGELLPPALALSPPRVAVVDERPGWPSLAVMRPT